MRVATEENKIKRRPGGGRKKKESTLFKEASQKYLDAAPEIADATLLRAIGGPVKIKCSHCGKEADYRIPGVTGDTKLLEYVNDRIHGKPVQKQEIDLNARMQVENKRLVQLHVLVRNTMDMMNSRDTTELETEIEKVPLRIVEGVIDGG